jgi:hypothetical protein
MSTATASSTLPRQSDPAELADELRHVRDLVFVRDLLREHGATSAELRSCDAVIDEAHVRLAEVARRASSAYAAAA